MIICGDAVQLSCIEQCKPDTSTYIEWVFGVFLKHVDTEKVCKVLTLLSSRAAIWCSAHSANAAKLIHLI